MPTFKNWRSQQLQRLKHDSDRMFERLCSDFGLPPVCRPLMEPDIVMRDMPDAIILEAELPGVSEENLEVIIEAGSLVVRCSQAAACETRMQSDVFESRFRLPCKVRTEEVEAVLAGKTLRITMPKSNRPESRRIPVKIVES